jgi:hypothetical protein
MYLTDFNMMLDNKLTDCFLELTLDKNKVNELFEIHQNEIKKDETKNETNDETNEEYYNEIKCNNCGKSTTSIRNSQIKSNNRSINKPITTRSVTRNKTK